MSQPQGPYQPQFSGWEPPPPVPPRRKPWLLASAGVVIAILATIVVVALVNSRGTDNSGPAPVSVVVESAPKPITRADLMAEYARIAPLDRTASPELIDSIAESACSLLDAGKSTDLLISTATMQYNANATAVMRLLVSYRCPKYLKDFK